MHVLHFTALFCITCCTEATTNGTETPANGTQTTTNGYKSTTDDYYLDFTIWPEEQDEWEKKCNGERTSKDCKAICEKPGYPGVCRAHIQRWYFNGSSCSTFVYGGCGDNGNNFPSEKTLHVYLRKFNQDGESNT
uniref:BPTI/Kunitz inhibitor domain-containing protein n=1 Tax=Amblyomma triste TaxID=251400 RepID=A0A023G0Y7_AMBTT